MCFGVLIDCCNYFQKIAGFISIFLSHNLLFLGFPEFQTVTGSMGGMGGCALRPSMVRSCANSLASSTPSPLASRASNNDIAASGRDWTAAAGITGVLVTVTGDVTMGAATVTGGA